MNFVLLYTAASVAVIHTAIGIDHYIPFAVMSKTNNWSTFTTVRVVLLCGFGHVFSSVIIGLIGVWLGSQLSFLAGVEDIRGEIAVWFLIAFGAVYLIWGLRKAVKNKPHRHINAKGEEIWHRHDHHDDHDKEHLEEHVKESGTSKSFWPLFIIFVLGPCEVLIPLIMYPAAESGALLVILVIIVFSVCTLGTMLACTFITMKGISLLPIKKVERYAHALAGFSILICGMAIKIFGL